MKLRTRFVGFSFLIAFLLLLALPGVGLAQDTTPPNITAFSFTPTSIDTSASSANVTVSPTLTDNSSGVSYLEFAFVDPSGAFVQRGTMSFAPPQTSVTPSVVLTFPRFSPAGTWKVLYLFLADQAGNTLFLDTNAFVARGFPTDLTVTSAADTTAPNITSFSFTPTAIDTTAASANVTVNFTVTDNLAGANFFQVVFVSPSGNMSQNASKSFAAGTTVTDSVTVTFPRFSENGSWKVDSVFVADAAGNTLILDNAGLATRGFATTLAVTTSATDSTAPTLTTFSFTPTSVNVTSADATVTANFQVADDLSGATTFIVSFVSPSGNFTLNASSSFAANTSVTGTANVTIPKGSESGTWTASVFLADAAGNTRILSASDLAGQGFATQLTVTNTPGDTTPPVITPTVTPAPGPNGWNTTVPVTVSWSVSDPESGIASSSGCGTASLSAETAGTTFTCSATNGAGLSNSVSVAVMIDLTAPIITPTVTPAPNAAGWNNTDVTVSWNLSDPTSGIDLATDVGCGTVTLTTEAAGTTLTCTTANGAGIFASASVTIKIDKTAPTLTFGAASPAPNAAGWNSTNVSFSYTTADNLSGVASATPASPVTITTEGAGLTASVVVTDVAGNSATFTTPPVNIDKTPPVVTPTVSPAPNAAGWNTTSPVTVSWSVSDPTPGSSITSSTGCTTSTVSAETAGTTFTCTATNIAGLSTANSVTVKLDTSPPVITASVTPAPNAAGWNNSDVTTAWSVTDSISGVASSSGCAATTISTETTGTTLTCSATNGAGLSSSASVLIKLDKTAPVTTATPAPGTVSPTGSPLATANGTVVVKSTSGATLGTIPAITCFNTLGLFVNLNAVDNAGGSGVASLTYAASGAQTIASTTVNGASANPSITALGLTTLTFAAKDVAANNEATKSESVVVGTGDDHFRFACAAPTPTFVIPTHGSVVVTGTVTINGTTSPFSKTITF